MVKDFAHGMIIMKIFRQHWRFKLQTVAIRFIINAENLIEFSALIIIRERHMYLRCH
jgi:hypothetical protein